MSGDLWFYHLERSSLDEVLPELLEKTLARGWRALVRSPDAKRREAIDQLFRLAVELPLLSIPLTVASNVLLLKLAREHSGWIYARAAPADHGVDRLFVLHLHPKGPYERSAAGPHPSVCASAAPATRAALLCSAPSPPTRRSRPGVWKSSQEYGCRSTVK